MIQRNGPTSNSGLDYILHGFHLALKGASWIIPDASVFNLYELGAPFIWGSMTRGLSTIPRGSVYGGSVTCGVMCQNSETTLEMCLTSIRPHVNELVVIDGGSNDRSLCIAEQHADRVISASWPESYGLQRNRLIDSITSPWMILLDSDEVVGPNFGISLRRVIKYAEACGAGVIWLLRSWPRAWSIEEPFNRVRADEWRGHWLLWPDPQARVLSRRHQPRYEGDLHEHVMLGVDGESILLADTNTQIHHLRLMCSSHEELAALAEHRALADSEDPHIIQLQPDLHIDSSLVSITHNISESVLAHFHTASSR